MFESPQSKVVLALALPVIILSQRAKFSMVTLLTQMILYLSLAYNADCLVTGRCNLWAWGSILFPLIQTIGFLFFNNKLDLQTPVRLPLPRSFQAQHKVVPAQENTQAPAPAPAPAK
jgi:hypothetical protein